MYLELEELLSVSISKNIPHFELFQANIYIFTFGAFSFGDIAVLETHPIRSDLGKNGNGIIVRSKSSVALWQWVELWTIVQKSFSSLCNDNCNDLDFIPESFISFQNYFKHSVYIVKTLVRSTIFVWNHIYEYGEWQRKFSAEFWDAAVFPNKLVKIVLVILQNIASVIGCGRGRVHKSLQYISWIDICSAKIWNGNVITTVESSWCITNVVTIFCERSFPLIHANNMNCSPWRMIICSMKTNNFFALLQTYFSYFRKINSWIKKS